MLKFINEEIEKGFIFKAEQFGKSPVFGVGESTLCILYKHKLDEWNALKDVKLITTVDPGGKTPGRKGEIGFVPTRVERIAHPSDNTIAIVCSPPVMIKYPFSILANPGFADENTFTTLENRMKCGVGRRGRCNICKVYVCNDGPVFTFAQLKELPDEY